MTTQYFKQDRDTCQGDPVSAYLFILALEILFLLTKTNPCINRLNFFDNCYLYSAYADGTIFFLSHLQSLFRIKTTLKQKWNCRHRCPERGKVAVCGWFTICRFKFYYLDCTKISGTLIRLYQKVVKSNLA